MATTIRNTYDEVPYPSLAYAQSHPDRLATLATLLGMKPRAVDRCRVLELGCATAGNLIPMAYGLPGSEFVGIDLSARQIAEGQAAVAALGLKNVLLKRMDILEVTPDLGRFDYVIAHGVYSWVPPPVRDKLFDICRHNLAPDGVAYVSYNTYPGWHMMNIIRDMMLYQTRGLADMQQRAAKARAALTFLSESVPAENTVYGSIIKAYGSFLQDELKKVGPKEDAFLLHDELEDVNDPVYFYQFAERAMQHGLQYLIEAQFSTAVPDNFPAKVVEVMRGLAADIVDTEQNMDFLRNRMFRQTLLCHEEVALSRTLDPGRMESFYVASQARPVSPEADVAGDTVEKFRSPEEAVLAIDHPVSKAAMLHLGEIWPRAVSFDALFAEAVSRVRPGSPSSPDDGVAARDRHLLGANLLKAFSYSGSLVELHVHAPQFVMDVGERPVASLWARFQSQNSSRLTNMRHERSNVSAFHRYVLRLLDGQHDRGALLKSILEGPVAEGALVVEQEGKAVQDPAQLRRLLAEELEAGLRGLARAALLVG